MPKTPIALSIAGSDGSAGAGLQADLKTFLALGVYGTTITTVLTAQNTREILSVHEVPGSFIKAQFEALFSDLNITAMKTGLLTGPAMIQSVAENIKTHASGLPLVIDPVMRASSGRDFMDDQTREVFKSTLAPLASLLTPNLNEAARLLGRDPARSRDEMRTQAEALRNSLAVGAVLLKGGHLNDAHLNDAHLSPELEAWDILYDGSNHHEFKSPRIDTINNHGTGCTLSAAITAHLARGASLVDAIDKAKYFVTNALRHSGELKIGDGPGPLNHGWALRDEVD